MSTNVWRLSPSDFAFLWEDCRRCFYLKVVSDFRHPRKPMARVFKEIDARMRAHFDGRRIETVVPSLPGGVLDCTEHWVRSAPISFPHRGGKAIIRGKIDAHVKFDDGTYGVIDFKTSERNDEHIPLYARQLHAYAYALENAEPGNLALSPIRKLGLLVFEPDAFSGSVGAPTSLSGGLTWVGVPRDDKTFMDFLDEVDLTEILYQAH